MLLMMTATETYPNLRQGGAVLKENKNVRSQLGKKFGFARVPQGLKSVQVKKNIMFSKIRNLWRKAALACSCGFFW
jgi:hypothetical protein